MQRYSAIPAMVVALILATLSQAQDDGQAQRRSVPPHDLKEHWTPTLPWSKAAYCENAAVRKELGVNCTQQERLHALLQELSREAPPSPDLPSALQQPDLEISSVPWNPKDSTSSKAMQEYFGAMGQHAKQTQVLAAKEENAIQQILELRQLQRLNQIVLQQKAPFVFFHGDVADKLMVSAAQRRKMRSRWIDDLGKERQSIMGMPNPVRPRAATEAEIQERIKQIQGEFDRAEKARSVPLEIRRQLIREAEQRAISDVLALLTDEQQAIWKTMTGEPVDLNPKP